jgi:hypothetical protein
MKSLLFFTLFAFTIISNAFADVNKVSYLALKNFKSNYGEAKEVTWTTTRDYSKATFMLDDQKMEVFYAPNGELIGTSTKMQIKELPSAVKKNVTKKMEGYTIVEAIRFQSPDDDCYYVSVENDQVNVILKVTEFGYVSLFKKTKK